VESCRFLTSQLVPGAARGVAPVNVRLSQRADGRRGAASSHALGEGGGTCPIRSMVAWIWSTHRSAASRSPGRSKGRASVRTGAPYWTTSISGICRLSAPAPTPHRRQSPPGFSCILSRPELAPSGLECPKGRTLRAGPPQPEAWPSTSPNRCGVDRWAPSWERHTRVRAAGTRQRRTRRSIAKTPVLRTLQCWWRWSMVRAPDLPAPTPAQSATARFARASTGPCQHSPGPTGSDGPRRNGCTNAGSITSLTTSPPRS